MPISSRALAFTRLEKFIYGFISTCTCTSKNIAGLKYLEEQCSEYLFTPCTFSFQKVSDSEQFYTASLQAFKDMNPKATEAVITRHMNILNKCKSKSKCRYSN
jgi:hypothetical protein